VIDGIKCKEITDVALVSYLLTAGGKMVRFINRGGRTAFYFIDEELDDSIMRYYNRQGVVDALTFAETLRNIKSLAVKKAKEN